MRGLRWGWLLAGLVFGGGAMAAKIYYVRPGLEQYEAHRDTAPVQDGALTATWFGTAAVLLSDGRYSVFIDPFFTRPAGFWRLVANRPIAPDEALIRSWLERAGVTRLDAVLVSHSHFDHAMDAGVVARLTGATLMGSESTLNIGRGAGLPEERLRPARSPASFGPFRVSFIESRHGGTRGGPPAGDIDAPLVPPARYGDYRQGGTFSILVAHPQGKALHHGSSGFAPGALNGVHADVVFLGIALLGDLPSYLAEVVDAVGAQRVFPVHWDDFTRPLDQPLLPMPAAVHLDRFFDEFAQLRPGLELRTLEPNRRAALFPRATL